MGLAMTLEEAQAAARARVDAVFCVWCNWALTYCPCIKGQTPEASTAARSRHEAAVKLAKMPLDERPKPESPGRGRYGTTTRLACPPEAAIR